MFHHLWLGVDINNSTDLPRLHHTLIPNILNYEQGFNMVIIICYFKHVTSMSYYFSKIKNLTSCKHSLSFSYFIKGQKAASFD